MKFWLIMFWINLWKKIVKNLVKNLYVVACFLSLQFNVKGANFRVSAVSMRAGLGPQWRYVSIRGLNRAAEARRPLW